MRINAVKQHSTEAPNNLRAIDGGVPPRPRNSSGSAAPRGRSKKKAVGCAADSRGGSRAHAEPWSGYRCRLIMTSSGRSTASGLMNMDCSRCTLHTPIQQTFRSPSDLLELCWRALQPIPGGKTFWFSLGELNRMGR